MVSPRQNSMETFNVKLKIQYTDKVAHTITNWIEAFINAVKSESASGYYGFSRRVFEFRVSRLEVIDFNL